MPHYKKMRKQELEKLAAQIIIKVKNEGADPHKEIQQCGLHPNLQEQLGHMFNVGSFLDRFRDTEGDNRAVSFPLVDTEKFIGNPEEPLSPENPVKGVMKKKVVVTKKGPTFQGDLPDLENVEEKQETPEEIPEEKAEEVKEASVELASLSREKLAAAIDRLKDQQYAEGMLYLDGVYKLASAIKKNAEVLKELAEYVAEPQLLEDITKVAGLEEIPLPSKKEWKIKPKTRYILLADKIASHLENLQEISGGVEYLEALQRDR